ncbi:MAG: phosphatase PAP2 family protein [Desulfurococcaceae archaeon]
MKARKTMISVISLIVFTYLVKIDLFKQMDQVVYGVLHIGDNVLVITISGTANIYATLLLVLSLLLLDLIRMKRFTSTNVELLSLMFMTLLLTYGLKMTLKIPRPGIYMDTPTDFLGELELYGYPSGHVARATAISMFISNKWKNMYIRLFLYTWVFAVCITRLLAGVHWLSDVIGGLIAGMVAYHLVEVISPYIFEKSRWFRLSLSL